MKCKITILRGDGIGPEISDAAIAVLGAVESKFGHSFDVRPMPIGGDAIDMTGVPLPEETVTECKKSDAVLLGAVGGPKWEDLKQHMRPERSVLSLRSALGLYVGLSPLVTYDSLIQAGALRQDIAKKGANIMLVREMLGGIYYGEHGYRDGAEGQEAFDSEVYSINEIERIATVAFELAATRSKHVTSVDKADILSTGKLWRATVDRIAKRYPDIKVDHMLVGNCANELITSPYKFDVILTSNMFGDILSTEFAAIAGSIGMLPSCSIGGGKTGLYSPVHGAAADIAGKDEANPIAMILSSAMMLSTSLGLVNEAAAVDNAVKHVLNKGLRTKDIACGKKSISCSRMGEEIALAVLNA